MNFECKKTENCFADSRTYEYRISISAESFLNFLCEWQIRYNHKLRRPTFIAEKDRVRIKGILQGTIIRVSYPNDHWEQCKTEFENWIQKLEI